MDLYQVSYGLFTEAFLSALWNGSDAPPTQRGLPRAFAEARHRETQGLDDLPAISALELDIMCCGRKTESGMWDIRRDQSTGLAVLGASTQLVAISAEQIQTLHLSKGSGKQNKSL